MLLITQYRWNTATLKSSSQKNQIPPLLGNNASSTYLAPSAALPFADDRVDFIEEEQRRRGVPSEHEGLPDGRLRLPKVGREHVRACATKQKMPGGVCEKKAS